MALVQRALLVVLAAMVTTIVVGLLAQRGRLKLEDAILLGNAICVILGLTIGRWQSRKEATMDRRRHFWPQEQAEVRVTIDTNGGSVTMPGEQWARPFDILVVDLTGEYPKIALMNRRENPHDTPPVA